MKRLAYLGAIQLSLYGKDHFKPEAFELYSDVIDRTFEKKDLEKNAILKQYNPKKEEDARCVMVIGAALDNKIAETALALATLQFMNKRAGKVFSIVVPSCEDKLTLEVAAKVCGYKNILDAMDEITDAYNRLELLLMCDEKTADLARSPLKIEYFVADFMNGIDIFDIEIAEGAYGYYPGLDPAIYGYQKEMAAFSKKVLTIYEKRAKQVEESPDLFDEYQNTIVIAGEKESGRTTFVKRIAYEIQLPILFCDADFILQSKEMRRVVRKLMLTCSLMEAGLCVRGIPKTKEGEDLMHAIRKQYDRFGMRPLFYTVDKGVKPLPVLSGTILYTEIEKMSAQKAYEIWNGFLTAKNLTGNLDIFELASKMKLTAGQINRITDQMLLEYEGSGMVPDMKAVYKLCYMVLDDGRYENIKRVESGFYLSDICTSQTNLRTLRDICGQVNNRKRVYDDWGLSVKYEYGRCVSVILAGPPGTGKTMAVHALSNELGLELYKVDLSQLIDKYIGETEKRLEEVFQKAEKSNMILFFDEADAVMSKRSETKEAKDKYANTEIAYILQRMEEYDGIVILATNYLQNIDPAFMRRIKYVVNFDIPDEDTRLAIWKGSFTKDVPLEDSIDWDFLAAQFEISGGSIKNVALNAVFLAAEEQKPVSMRHILRSAHRENTKDKRIAFTSDYGQYGYLIQDLL